MNAIMPLPTPHALRLQRLRALAPDAPDLALGFAAAILGDGRFTPETLRHLAGAALRAAGSLDMARENAGLRQLAAALFRAARARRA